MFLVGFFQEKHAHSFGRQGRPAFAFVNLKGNEVLALRAGRKSGTCKRMSYQDALQVMKLLLKGKMKTCNVFH